VSVDRIGEEEARLPLARYEYGAATSAEQVLGSGATIPRVLKYSKAGSVALPPEVSGLAGTLATTWQSSPTRYKTTHTLQDFTGDGLPDLIFPNPEGGSQLWIARNETDFGIARLCGKLSDALVPTGARRRAPDGAMAGRSPVWIRVADEH
jgi:hypothetical protein